MHVTLNVRRVYHLGDGSKLTDGIPGDRDVWYMHKHLPYWSAEGVWCADPDRAVNTDRLEDDRGPQRPRHLTSRSQGDLEKGILPLPWPRTLPPPQTVVAELPTGPAGPRHWAAYDQAKEATPSTPRWERLSSWLPPSLTQVDAASDPAEPAGDGASTSDSDDYCRLLRRLPPPPPPPPPAPSPPAPPPPPPELDHISARNIIQYTLRRPALWFWYAWEEHVYVDDLRANNRPQAEFDWSEANCFECWRRMCCGILEHPTVYLRMGLKELMSLCHRGGPHGQGFWCNVNYPPPAWLRSELGPFGAAWASSDQCMPPHPPGKVQVAWSMMQFDARFPDPVNGIEVQCLPPHLHDRVLRENWRRSSTCIDTLGYIARLRAPVSCTVDMMEIKEEEPEPEQPQPPPPPPPPPLPPPPPPPHPAAVTLLHDWLPRHDTPGMQEVRENARVFYDGCPETQRWVAEEATWAQVAHMNALVITPGMELEDYNTPHAPAHLAAFPPDCRNAGAVRRWLDYANELFEGATQYAQLDVFHNQTIEVNVDYRMRNLMPIMRAIHRLTAMVTALPPLTRFAVPPAGQVANYLPVNYGPRYPFPPPPAATTAIPEGQPMGPPPARPPPRAPSRASDTARSGTSR